ncbi:hypothetical protein TEA_019136 [Camellia sinensis var. sinensis]|uniref:Glutamine amidotransferase domain-containing protein n=1 Tax=Camellia sinensis var. sinensis TaxID=542762 RepID=A0A4S4EQC4_CAMSN|nr:hypothetical protein TEA_019136 [Camellia sinensis var. sinensis]
MAVGVLALHGSFNEHIAALRRLGVKGVEIRKPEQLQSVTSLIIPGEHHHDQACRFPALREFVKMGRSVCGTCAGLIFLANKAVSVPENWRAGTNWGPRLYCPPELLWQSVGPEVEVVADITITSNKTVDPNSTLESQEESTGSVEKVIVGVKQGNLLGTAFHPELTADTRWHSYFLKMGEVGEGDLSSICAVEEELSFDQQPKIDLPIFQ